MLGETHRPVTPRRAALFHFSEDSATSIFRQGQPINLDGH